MHRKPPPHICIPGRRRCVWNEPGSLVPLGAKAVEGPDVVRVGSAVVVEYPIGVEVERDDLRGILKFHAGIEDVGNQDRRRLVIWKELCPRISAEHLGTVDVRAPCHLRVG